MAGGGPNPSMPAIPAAQKMSNKSPSSAKGVNGSKTAQANGHKGYVARLNNKLPVK